MKVSAVRFLGMKRDYVSLALLFVLVPWIVLKWRLNDDPAMKDIMVRLQHECDPTNPEADYSWSQTSMPTESKREAIIQKCCLLGPSLLPDIRFLIKTEKNEELRGMLIVIAAALKDAEYLESAGQQMAWSSSPALRISAAKTLRRLRDPRSIDWFMAALNDPHFSVNGGCGLWRENFYPVRSIAEISLREIMADLYPGDEVVKLTHRQSVKGMPHFGNVENAQSYFEMLRRWDIARSRCLSD
jgi:hypothetical protein